MHQGHDSYHNSSHQPRLSPTHCGLKHQSFIHSKRAHKKFTRHVSVFAGVLSNTEPLSYERKHNYILEVRAEDCGGKESTTLLINIRVLAKCTPGWTSIAPRVAFTPGESTHTPVAPAATLEVCPQTCGAASSVSTHVTLSTDHIGKGCDRDTYSIHSQRKLCGKLSGSYFNPACLRPSIPLQCRIMA